MSKSLSSTHFLNLGRIVSERSSSTRTVEPVIKTGSSASVDLSFNNALKDAIAPPASLSNTLSTSLVAEVFSKSVTITARISSSRMSISDERISVSASYFAVAYAITLPIGEAHNCMPVSVICVPNIRNLFFAVLAKS